MFKLRKLLTLALTLAAFGAYAGPALADTTVGQTLTAIFPCAQATVVQTSNAAYVVPEGTWSVSSWSTLAGADGGQMSLMVFRPLGDGSYLVVGESPVETLTPGGTNTFELGTPVVVQGGDLLGMWENAADCAAASSDTIGDEIGSSEPSVGDTWTPTLTEAYSLNISADLSPFTLANTFSSVFVCYSKWEQDGGAVFPVAQLDDLLSVGWWLPTAIPGNVDGGDNLGAYHLECNPPAGTTTTGTYVDDGGQVLGYDSGGGYAVAAAP